MGKQLHSPEPWREEGDHIVDANGRDIIGFGESDSDDTDRIIACVNFCKGAKTSDLVRHTVDDPEFPMRSVAAEAAKVAIQLRKEFRENHES